jgi:general stress protein YciG
MDDDKQRAIAREGGEAVSGNRAHMSDIGKKGGES